MNGIGKRIKDTRKDRRLTLEQVSNACGWEGASRISNYESGRRPVGTDELTAIAKALGVSPAWLLTGSGPKERDAGHVLSTFSAETVPLIPFNVLTDIDMGHGIPPQFQGKRMLCPMPHSDRAFAFMMQGDTMTSPTGLNSCPPGSYLFVDPARHQPAHDKPALVRLASGELIVAQYMEQAGRRWLRLLNPTYPRITEPFSVVGEIVGILLMP